MSTYLHILMVAMMLAVLLLGQTGSGSTGLLMAHSTRDASSELRYVTFRVLGLMKTKSGAT